MSYCKLWQSLIAADVEGIKRYSEELDAGHMYGLLACMLTARSWKVVTAGIDEGPMSVEEVCGDLVAVPSLVLSQLTTDFVSL